QPRHRMTVEALGRIVQLRDALLQERPAQIRAPLLQLVQAGRDLDQPLNPAPLIAVAAVPRLFPQLVRLVKLAAVEGARAGIEDVAALDGIHAGPTRPPPAAPACP